MGKGRGSPQSTHGGAHPPADGRSRTGRKGGNRYTKVFEEIDSLTGGEMQNQVKKLGPDDPVYYYDLDVQYRCEVRDELSW